MRTLFIDFDGTLHDSEAKFRVKLNGLFGFSGAHLLQTFLAVHQMVHQRHPDKHEDFQFQLKLVLERLRRPVDEAAIEELATRFKEAQQECWTEPVFFPDSLPFLDEVKHRGYRLCLATGDHAAEKACSVERMGGKKYFDHAFDQSILGMKGGDSYLRKALALTGSSREEAVVIGDSLPHDISPARVMGILTLWVNRKGEPLPPGSLRPDYEVKDLGEVLRYL